MPRKKVTVIERKLGQYRTEDGERVAGLACSENNTIELDTRLPANEWLVTLVHEALHLAFPEKSERQIEAAGRKIGNTLWRAGVRRIHQ